MVDTARINLYGKTIGVVQWDAKRHIAYFQYSPDFIGCGVEPAPLMMPVEAGRVYSFPALSNDTYKGLPGMIADSLPDTYGRALFDQWLSLTGRSSGNVIESLCFMGRRCMGALEFEPAIDVGYSSSSNIEIESLVDVAAKALNKKEAFSTNLSEDKKTAIAQIVLLGTSAGGQRAKAIIAYNKDTGEVRSGQIDAPEGFDYYLIKLDGVNATTGFKQTQNFGRLEYSFYQLVKNCGIEMSDSELFEENGRAHFLTKRFDRSHGHKLHIQTLCGLAHYDYRLPHAYSYEQAFNVMRQLRLPYCQAVEFFRRMVFNVVIRNQDDHTKNISFIMHPDGSWLLSPAYDMGYAYNPIGEWTAKHQMSINGKCDNVSRNDILECAKKNNIKEAKEIIDQVCECASHWKEIALNCGVPLSIVEQVNQNMLLNL